MKRCLEWTIDLIDHPLFLPTILPVSVRVLRGSGSVVLGTGVFFLSLCFITIRFIFMAFSFPFFLFFFCFYFISVSARRTCVANKGKEIPSKTFLSIWRGKEIRFFRRERESGCVSINGERRKDVFMNFIYGRFPLVSRFFRLFFVGFYFGSFYICIWVSTAEGNVW
jgi:hypothetical protein